MAPIRVLLVDDEPSVVDGLRRNLYRRFAVVTATSGIEGLTILEESLVSTSPIGVIVSDMRMPGMGGAEFLARARQVAPETVRIVLSGHADLDSTIKAVNEGDLFRFLTKPATTDELTAALESAVRQYQLVIAERQVLRQTLVGVAEVLGECLALASPPAQERTARVRTLLTAAAHELGLDEDWRLQIAAMLSQVGCIAVPAPVLAKIEQARPLTTDERDMYLAHRQVAEDLLRRIPRMDQIAEWIGEQITDLRELTPGAPEPDLSRACFAATEAFLAGYDAAIPLDETAEALTDSGRFTAEVVHAVAQSAHLLTPRGIPKIVEVCQVRPGMILDEDVHTLDGAVLARKGTEATDTLVWRLNNFALSIGVHEPIHVLIPIIRHLPNRHGS